MVKSHPLLTEAWVNIGSGLMDFEPDLCVQA